MIWLNVPIEEKDEAKALGAKWNWKVKKWYINDEADYNVFKRWISVNVKDSKVFNYLKQLAEISALEDEDTKEKLLPKQYASLTYVSEETVLARYLEPDNKNITAIPTAGTIPIFPFGCNKSQYKAVVNVLENQISVIQGPPGTGKTQTILNIIANVLLEGKTVQVVSNNNAAIENVLEKLSSPKYDLGFIVALLGNATNKKQFIENQNEHYPDFSKWILANNHLTELNDVKNMSAKLSYIFNKQEDLAKLKQEIAQLKLERKYFNQYLAETNIQIDLIKTSRNTSSKKIMELWQKVQALSESNKKPGLLFKLINIFIYGITDWSFYKQDVSKIITSFQGLFLKLKEKELNEHIADITNYLASVDQDLQDKMCDKSMLLLKDALARRYKKREKRKKFIAADLWSNEDLVLQEYPVILSTTFSSRSSLGRNVTYDYLIMDEASQVDVATGALALSCAKNAVIVGDSKQLPNVVTGKARKDAEKIFQEFNINEGYRFTKSFLQSILEIIPDVTSVMLKEHYRCHPKIINFCNQKFYKGELVIMTEDHGEKDVLTIIKTAEGNHERERYNQRQIDVIEQEVLPKCKGEKNQIGIISPYRNQVAELQKQLPDFEVATVHKFQGREKNTIIISTVDDVLTDFVDDPYLLNVAVSRAKKQLFLILSGNAQLSCRNISDLAAYIEYNNFEIKESNLYSIFDYLYTQYTAARIKFLSKHKKISEYDSENLMYGLMTDILSDDKFASLDIVCHFPLNMLIKDPHKLNDRESEYAMNPATHLDFLIYNRISKMPILAIEVDGYRYHKTGTTQAERDKLKNHILELYGIPLLRFSTNGSGETEIIKNKLDELMKK
jgi:superfamily I DNA and/or RNA helicase